MRSEALQVFLNKVDAEGFDYAVREYSSDYAEEDSRFEELLDDYNWAKGELERYVNKLEEEEEEEE